MQWLWLLQCEDDGQEAPRLGLTSGISCFTLVQIARDPVILKRQRHCDETEIEDEHWHSQDLAHLPAGDKDGEKDKKKHRK